MFEILRWVDLKLLFQTINILLQRICLILGSIRDDYNHITFCLYSHLDEAAEHQDGTNLGTGLG